MIHTLCRHAKSYFSVEFIHLFSDLFTSVDYDSGDIRDINLADKNKYFLVAMELDFKTVDIPPIF
jgi:hypothetical protein